MASGPDKYQEQLKADNAAAVNAQGAAQKALFIVPWRMDQSFGPTKEHDSCGSGEGGECGCGISPDEK